MDAQKLTTNDAGDLYVFTRCILNIDKSNLCCNYKMFIKVCSI